MRKARFEAELFEGHKGVTAVLVPFDPEAVWRTRPVRLAGRRHGWLVTGTANGARFDGYVGERWNRFFRVTTQPGKPRPDAMGFPGAEPPARDRSPRPAKRHARRAPPSRR